MTPPDTVTSSLNNLLIDLGCKTPEADIAKDSQSTIRDFLEKEKRYRRDARIRRLLLSSGIKSAQIRTFDDFDWSANPKLPKHDLLAFRNANWINEAHNLVLIGDAGLGKTHLAKALCYDAIFQGHSAYFISAFDLLGKIKRAQNPEARVDYFARLKVLAIDELGYTACSRDAADFLFQIIAKRAELSPTLVTTNLPPKQWGALFSGSTASAVLDRLSHNGRFITMEGSSYRLRSKRK
jgi:DNA replication protein DnaC